MNLRNENHRTITWDEKEMAVYDETKKKLVLLSKRRYVQNGSEFASLEFYKNNEYERVRAEQQEAAGRKQLERDRAEQQAAAIAEAERERAAAIAEAERVRKENCGHCDQQRCDKW